jgi:hypothetical protein
MIDCLQTRNGGRCSRTSALALLATDRLLPRDYFGEARLNVMDAGRREARGH